MKSVREFITTIVMSYLLVSAMMLVSCTSDTDVEVEEESEYSSATEWIDENLSTYYLYNEEYNALERDLTLSYSAFLDNTLMGMTTNVLDKKYYTTINHIPYYGYLLYSYVTCQASTKSRAVMSSREDVGFGIIATELVNYQDSLAIAIHGVYNNSPASEAGITRGSVITQINGELISWSSYLYGAGYNLLYPSEGDELTIFERNIGEQTITAATFEVNPILHYEIIDPNIGYLVYSQFDSNFDSDLEAVFEEFAAANITELILDLRINPGGYVSSAKLLGSMIGGSYTSGEIFTYYLMNGDMTDNSSNTEKIMGLTYDSSQRAFYTKFTSASTQLSTISPRVYCLVSESTASASELLINSLRGVGFEVILIGEQTNGKNVGMINLNTTIDGYEYDLLPITFENRNAKMEGEYYNGMEVDYEVNDLNDYLGFSDYGAEEPMVDKAIELITGETAGVPSTRAFTPLDIKTTYSGIIHSRSGGAIVPLQ